MKAYTTEPICPRLSHYNTSAGFAEEFRSPAGNTRPRIRWWLPAAYLSTVSYTHLDVYKRQTPSCSMLARSLRTETSEREKASLNSETEIDDFIFS